jgi:glycine oxidase
VIGAGAAGLTTATVLHERGARVRVVDRSAALGPDACSWFAGGMLAPWCEGEGAEPEVTTLGQEALRWWPSHYPATALEGTLVVAPPRDAAELGRWAARTGGHEWVDAERIGELEPDLAGRFRRALFYPAEGHLDPRRALAALRDRLAASGVAVEYGVEAEPDALDGLVADCRGFAAKRDLPGLRGVKGEMVLLHAPDIGLRRPIRLLHPRFPLYVVPRGEGVFMVGATSIESEERRRISVRSLVELLGAAYALHPAFGDAAVLEIGTEVRPAFADNLPGIRVEGRVVRVNGLYRHGFLLSPALAGQAADALLGPAQ